MEVKPSRYNLTVSNENGNYLVNTLSCVSIRLNHQIFDAVCQILEFIKDAGGIYPEGNSIAQLLLENGIIVKKDTDEFDQLIKKLSDTHQNTSTLFLTIAPTLHCNLNCYYCFENRNIRTTLHEMDIKSIVNFIDEHLEENGDLFINWFGGEPLLERDFIYNASKSIMNLTTKKNAKYTAGIVSNAFLLNEKAAYQLKESNIKTIQVTLDGTKERHNQVKRHLIPGTNDRVNTFDILIENILMASEIMDVTIRVNTSPRNFDNLPSLIDYLAAKGLANKLKTLYFYPLFNYTPNTQECYQSQEKTCFSMRSFAQIETTLQKKAFDRGFLLRNPLTSKEVICQAVRKNAFIIDSNGDLKKCENDLGIQETSISSIRAPYFLNPENMEKWIRYQPGEALQCKECPFFPLCYSGCPHQSHYKVPTEQKCISFKYNWEETIPLYYAQTKQLNLKRRSDEINELKSGC